MPNPDGSPSKGETGYVEPNSGLLTVGNAGPGSNVTAYNPSQATATPAAATTYDPSKYTVTPDQTVQGQTAKIVGDDSVLMQQARTRANQDAQAKGLLSSSLAVGAGQNAVIQNALPIASQDASTYNQAMTNTANAENVAKGFGAGAQNQASLNNSGILTQNAQVNAQSQNTQKGDAAQAFNQQALQYVDNTTKIALANLDVQNRQVLQANANAQQMFADTVKNIAGIAVDATLSKDAKDQATASQLELLRQGLATTSGVTNFGLANTVPPAVMQLDLSQYFQQAA